MSEGRDRSRLGSDRHAPRAPTMCSEQAWQRGRMGHATLLSVRARGSFVWSARLRWLTLCRSLFLQHVLCSRNRCPYQVAGVASAYRAPSFAGDDIRETELARKVHLQRIRHNLRHGIDFLSGIDVG